MTATAFMARRDAAGVRLLTRNGHDFGGRFPLVAAAVAVLPARSCLIDGEAIVTDQNGLAVFDLIRGRRPGAPVVLCAFDLLELDGEDLRREPIETRKSTLRSLLRGKMAQSSTVRLAHSAARALCQSAWARPIGPAAPTAGSRSRTRPRPRCGAKPKRTGAEACPSAASPRLGPPRKPTPASSSATRPGKRSVFLLRGPAGTPRGGQAADPARGPPHRRQHRQAAGVAAAGGRWAVEGSAPLQMPCARAFCVARPLTVDAAGIHGRVHASSQP